MILKGYIFGICYAVVCLLLSLVLYKLGLPKKYTRKVVHILVGFEWVILYHYMGAGIHFLLVCILFLLLLAVAYKGQLMPMISSEGDNAPGTVYYAAAMTGVAIIGCFVPDVMLPFGIGVMCTSVGDGFAGVVGQSIKRGNPKIYGKKTLFGTLANVLASALSAFVISSLYSVELGIVSCLFIGVLSTELELVTPYGLDNISVTWGTTALAYLLINFSDAAAYLLPILLSPIIVMLALAKKALTPGGVVAALALDLAVSLAFKNSGFVVLCIFFVGSIIIDKIKKRYKNKGRIAKEAKGDCRDYMQVIANGMPAFVAAIAFLITRKPIFAVPFVASMAEAFSDTAASGIGVFSTKTYDPFRLRKCEKGLSGGMSLIGTGASLLAASVVGFAAWILDFSSFGFVDALIVIASAFFGAIFDSFLGSVFQVKYKCTVCGAITETTEHCEARTIKQSGFSVIDNDVVNLISCSFAAVIATVLAILI